MTYREGTLTEYHAVICITHKLPTARFQLCIQFMEHDITQQGTQGSTLDSILSTIFVESAHHCPVKELFMNEGAYTTILNRAGQYLYQLAVVDGVKKLF